MKPPLRKAISPAAIVAIAGALLLLNELRGLPDLDTVRPLWLSLGVTLVSVGALLHRRREKAEAAMATRNQDLRDDAAEILDYNIKALIHEPGELPWHSSPAILELIVPLTEPAAATSWIGGFPSLPDDAPWPEIGNKAAAFRAQIDCRDLPEGIWGGMGPKFGWLVFFAGDYREDAVVLHTTTLGRPRTSPIPVEQYGGYEDPALWLAQATGQEGRPAPRWPVRIRPAGAHEPARSKWRQQADNPRHRFLNGADLLDPIYHPFDWVSARALVEATKADIEFEIRAMTGRKKDQTEERLGRIEEQQQRLSQTLVIAKRLEEWSRGAPFGDSAWANLQEMGQDLGVVAPSGLAPPEAERRRDRVMRRYARLLETHARTLYVECPYSLPPKLKETLERVWAFEALHEWGQMGGQTHEGFIYDRMENPVFLLELPSSDLLGWMFGDTYSWGVFIPPEALEVGDFSIASGGISN